MVDEAIQVGDRVINLQVPGIFTVVERRGRFLEIESDGGLQMTVEDSTVRRLDEGGVPAPADEPAE